MINVQVRPANINDARFLWELRIDPVTQKSSIHSEDIPWESHQHWFQEKLANASTRIYIAESTDETPVGQIRFEKKTPIIAEVSVAVIPAARGKGYGKAMLSEAIQQACHDLKVNQIDALVKTDNEPSLRLFIASGFEYQQELMVDDVTTVKLIFRK